jgi:hypothetical protein
MKLSDRYRQNYCDIYPQSRNKPSLNLGSKAYVLFLAVVVTSIITYFK